MANTRICTIDDCGNKHVAKGLCDTHYRMLKKRGTTERCKLRVGASAKWIDEHALSFSGHECLIWPYTKDKDGYPRGRYPGFDTDRAHRIVCWLVHGEPPNSDYEAGHSCGKGHEGCISQHHLSWRSPIENSADKIAHGTTLRGERGSVRKLTWDDVNEIRAMLKTTSHAQLAKKFGVSRPSISLIAGGKTWKQEWQT